VGRGKKVVLIPPPESRVEVVDPRNLGPLPTSGVAFLSQLGARRIEIVAKDGRSWIIAGINEWKGSLRPFVARVFSNGFVRDYLAIPVDSYRLIVDAIARMAEAVMASSGEGVSDEGGQEENEE